jgi:toxin YoeB
VQLAFDPAAWEEYSWWLVNDRKTLVRINKLLDETLRNPRIGIGKPEQLRGFEEEIWSRRITLEHRLVYRVTADSVIVMSCRHHY